MNKKLITIMNMISVFMLNLMQVTEQYIAVGFVYLERSHAGALFQQFITGIDTGANYQDCFDYLDFYNITDSRGYVKRAQIQNADDIKLGGQS